MNFHTLTSIRVNQHLLLLCNPLRQEENKQIPIIVIYHFSSIQGIVSLIFQPSVDYIYH